VTVSICVFPRLKASCRENNYHETIHLIKGRIEDTNLPVEKVDIIVSEWMGYFLLFEGMLDSFIYARDHHLTPGGLLVPNKCNLNLVGCSDPGTLAVFAVEIVKTRLFQNATTN
jgi:hypothetical protein